MDIKLAPLGHRIMLEPVNVEEQTDWGFKLDVGDTFKREVAATELGRIVAIGPNAWKAYDDGEPWAAVGDVVIFAKHAGKFIAHPKEQDKKYVVINDDDVQVKVEDYSNE